MDKIDETNRETFQTGAVRDETDYRYDLLPMTIISETLPDVYLPLARSLLQVCAAKCNLPNEPIGKKAQQGLYNSLADCVTYCLPAVQGESRSHGSRIVHLYAQAMHEGASKYGERNWEKGIPIPNLVNHALYHLYQLWAEDKTENHLSHLVWNVMTIIHFCYEK